MTADQRNQIIDASVRLRAESPKPSLDAVAEASGVPGVTIRRAYDGFGAILDDYFVRLLERRDEALEEIPGEADLPMEDRLGSRLFLILDQLEENPEFVRHAFKRHAARWGSPFREALNQELAGILGSEDVPGINQLVLGWRPVQGVLLEGQVQTIRVWLEDDSEGRERATALVDRLLAFFADVATSRSVERGLDVLRYAYGAGFIPLVGGWYDRKSS